jgi:hypothetical protein
MNGLMRKLIPIFIVLIGVYTLLRNNVFGFPDQIMWIMPPTDLFYKTLLPSLMIIMAICSILMIEKHAYFNLATGTMIIDAIYRFSIGINHLQGYLYYKNIPTQPTVSGSTKVITNLWPSHLMLLFEIILIAIALWIIKKQAKVSSEK